MKLKFPSLSVLGFRGEPPKESSSDPSSGVADQAQSKASSKHVHKTVKQSLKDLVLSTEIHGISSVFNQEKHVVERILWVLVILTSLCLSLRDGVLFFQRYMSEPTQTSAFISHNRSMHLHNVTLCIRLRENAYRSSIDISDPTVVREYLKNVSITRYELRRLAEPEFNDLLVMTALMLQDIVRMEHYKPNSTSETDLDITVHTQGWKPSDILNITQASSSVQTYLFYTRLGVDFAKLPGWAGEAICKRLSITFTNTIRVDTTREGELEVCNRHLVSWFGRLALEVDVVPVDYVCYALEDDISFHTLSDYGHLQLNYLNMFDEKRAFEITTFIGVIDLDSRLMAVDMGGNTIPIWFGLNKNYYLRLDGHFHSLNLSRRHCAPHGDSVECSTVVRAVARRKVCGCWPLSWFAFYERGTFEVDRLCTDFTLSPESETDTDFYGLLSKAMDHKCNTSSFIEAPRAAVEAKCYDPCDAFIFTTSEIGVFESPVANVRSVDANCSMLTIRMLDFSYAIFKEQLIYEEWRFFISSLGGTVGFWLGASILALVSLLMAVVRLFLRITHGDEHSCCKTSETPEEVAMDAANEPLSLENLAAEMKSLKQQLQAMQEKDGTVVANSHGVVQA